VAVFTNRLHELIDANYDLGLKSYPIFSEAHRDVLNTKIIQHYWYYEIGQETWEMFKFHLNRKLNEIMPYYNQLYLSELIAYDPLSTMNYTDNASSHNVSDSTGTSAQTSTQSSDAKGRTVTSDTPQTMLSGSEDYASGASDSVSHTGVAGTGEGSTAGHETADGTVSRVVAGSQGHAAQLLAEYRKVLLNLDMSVIKELEGLFMLIWDDNSSFTGGKNVYFYSWNYWVGLSTGAL
jgi:hypothetical protein